MNFQDFRFIDREVEGIHFAFARPEDAIANWDAIEPYIDRVVGKACHGEFTTEQVRQLVESGGISIGIAARHCKIVMVVAAEEIVYPNSRAVNILAMSGQGMDAFMKTVLPAFARWSRQAGFDWIEYSVSAGMERMHQRYGAKTIYRNMRYDLKEINDSTQ